MASGDDQGSGLPAHLRKAAREKSTDDRFWFAATLVSAALAFIFIASMGVVVVSSDKPNEMAQAAAPFVVAAIAAVTFCTVVWRGILNTRQLRIQAEQVSHQANQLVQLVRQNDAKEEENLAKLLQEGAKLLAEPDKQAQVLAGIATLELLLTGGSERFAFSAMDLVGDLLLKTYPRDQFAHTNAAAFRALQAGEDMGKYVRSEGAFAMPIRSACNSQRWRYVPGFRKLRFRGGELSPVNFAKMERAIVSIDNVELRGSRLRVDDRFNNCKFVDCTILGATGRGLFRNSFHDCDFTGAELDADMGAFEGPAIFCEGGNYYAGEPPVDTDGFSLQRFFLDEQQAENFQAEYGPYDIR